MGLNRKVSALGNAGAVGGFAPREKHLSLASKVWRWVRPPVFGDIGGCRPAFHLRVYKTRRCGLRVWFAAGTVRDNTVPFSSRVAVWDERVSVQLNESPSKCPVGWDCRTAPRWASPLETCALALCPPATSTLPLANKWAVCFQRAIIQRAGIGPTPIGGIVQFPHSQGRRSCCQGRPLRAPLPFGQQGRRC